MKKVILIVSILCTYNVCLSQKIESSEYVQSKSTIQYAPEMPHVDSYSVQLNNTNAEVPEEVLLKINYYRRADSDFLWKVNENLEILIYKINRSNSNGSH